jgi:AcrR family transcriptional regulator
MAKAKQVLDASTEEKIKEAARKVFMSKGFAGTRTRDIAEASGINLALLNYYFRSKEKLFNIIMQETLYSFLERLSFVFNDPGTTLTNKIESIAVNYIDFLIANPNVPIFIMSELHNKSTDLLEKIPLKISILKSEFVKQYTDAAEKGKITERNPIHFLLNIMGMVMYPFIAETMLKGITQISHAQFVDLMEERKTKIPTWIKTMMKAK